MPFCPHCGSQVDFGDARCGSCREALPVAIAEAAAATQSAAHTPVPTDWTKFTCWDSSFSLCYPADWQPMSPPVSEDASLSCVGPDGYTLLEAFGMANDRLRGRDLVKMIADGIVGTLGQEDGHANGRLRHRRSVAFRNAEDCERVVVSYSDQGLETTTDYFVVGSGGKAVLLALKVLSPEYERRLPVYEQIMQTLDITWLSAKREQAMNTPSKPEYATDLERARDEVVASADDLIRFSRQLAEQGMGEASESAEKLTAEQLHALEEIGLGARQIQDEIRQATDVRIRWQQLGSRSGPVPQSARGTTCDLCAQSTGHLRIMDGSTMVVAAMNDFGVKVPVLQHLPRAQRGDQYYRIADVARHAWWELCPRCHKAAQRYRWFFDYYKATLRRRLGIFGAVLGALACGAYAWFGEAQAGHEPAQRIIPAVLTAALGALLFGLVGAFLGYVTGAVVDFHRSDPVAAKGVWIVAGAAAALWAGWDLPAAEGAWQILCRVGLGIGGAVIGRIIHAGLAAVANRE